MRCGLPEQAVVMEWLAVLPAFPLNPDRWAAQIVRGSCVTFDSVVLVHHTRCEIADGDPAFADAEPFTEGSALL